MKTITNLRKYFVIVLFFAAIAMSCSNASAQRISTMSVTTFSGGYSPLIIDPTATTLASIGGSVYYGTYTMPLPFAFSYDNTSYGANSTIYVRWGHISFTNPLDPNYQNYTGNSSYSNAIMPFMGLQVSAPDGSTRIMYKISGSSPNRVFTIEWYKFGDYPSQASGNVSYQLKMYEGTNMIEFIYEKYNFSVNYANAYYHGTGLNGSLNPSFISIVSVASSFTTPASNYRYAYPLPVELSSYPKTLTYGGVIAGTSVTLCMNVQHVGTGGTLTLNSASITGSSDFSIVSSPPSTLAVGQVGQYCIKFAPTGNGARSAVLTIVSNGQDSGTQSITLNGTGFSPLISVDSLVRFKKTRTRLGDSLTQWVHITSSGQAPLTFNAFQIVGIDADQYFISYFPANPLASGVTDSLAITYVPTREGLRGATLNITNNSSNSPLVAISLKGTGILPHIVLYPTSLQFDSTAEGDTVCKTVDVWNSGTDTLRIKKNFLTSNDGDFHYIGLTGSDMAIAPDHHKTLSICFIPLQQGTRQARLLLQTNIIPTYETPRRDTGSIVTLDMTGNGLPLGVFGNSFSGLPILDSAIVGTSICRTDTLKNTGDADIMVTGAIITGANATNFSKSGLTFPFLLKSRSSKTFTICGIPDQQGLRNGAITFTGTTGGRTIALSNLLGVFGLNSCIAAIPSSLFDNVTLPITASGTDSTQCVQIVNCGDVATIYSVAINGAAKADYSVTPAVSSMIGPNDTAKFCVTFKPSVLGPQSLASLDVTSSDKSVSVPLSGSTGCAELGAVTPSVPNTGVFETGKFDIVINNTGSFTWDPGTITITPAAEFTLDGPPTITGVPPNQTITVHLKFSSTTKGTFTAKVSFGNGGPCGMLSDVSLSGNAIAGSVKETASEGFSLEQSYPNPSQGKTSFTYMTPKDGEVRITLNDMTGKLVKTLTSGRISAGEHTVNFDATSLPSGTYVYVLESGTTRLVRQMILTK